MSGKSKKCLGVPFMDCRGGFPEVCLGLWLGFRD